MFAYIASHMGYIVVTLVLVLIAAAIIIRMVKDRKSGKGGCGGDCGSCGCCCGSKSAPQEFRRK